MCTSPVCFKRFGSKNDWKRHENTKHYQNETWICGRQAANRVGRCLENCSKRENFKEHLRKDHGVQDEDELKEETRKRRVGNNWSGAFWCGFCKTVVKLEKKNNQAWDERFDHIDDLHFKDGKDFASWYPSNTQLSKAELQGNKEEQDRVRREAFAGGEDDSVGFEDEQEAPCCKDDCSSCHGGISSARHSVRYQPGQVGETSRELEEPSSMADGHGARFCVS